MKFLEESPSWSMAQSWKDCLGVTSSRVRISPPPPMTIEFKKLEIKNLGLLFKWLNTPHVTEWYGHKKFTLDEVKQHYLPKINGTEPTKSYIVMVDNKQVGYIQEYFIKDDPELLKYVDRDAAGIDLFIGELEYLGRGLGQEIIKEFLGKIVFKEDGVTTCIIDPLVSNPRMIHVCEKAGFRYTLTTGEKEPRYLMKIFKNELEV